LRGLGQDGRVSVPLSGDLAHFAALSSRCRSSCTHWFACG
jgi:hypothetical protein